MRSECGGYTLKTVSYRRLKTSLFMKKFSMTDLLSFAFNPELISVERILGSNGMALTGY